MCNIFFTSLLINGIANKFNHIFLHNIVDFSKFNIILLTTSI